MVPIRNIPNYEKYPDPPIRAAHLLRAAGNVINLSTPLGLLVALAGRARLRPGPQALILAEEYRLGVPKAGAFVVGGVILVPGGSLDQLDSRHPGALDHEAVHCWQYFWCAGLPFFPLYSLASGWSWLRRGDPASGNWFERNAGLARGGYVERPVSNAGFRWLLDRLTRTGLRSPESTSGPTAPDTQGG